MYCPDPEVGDTVDLRRITREAGWSSSAWNQ
jgi:hypothetical protein